jgi:hypothetical protein
MKATVSPSKVAPQPVALGWGGALGWASGPARLSEHGSKQSGARRCHRNETPSVVRCASTIQIVCDPRLHDAGNVIETQEHAGEFKSHERVRQVYRFVATFDE